MGALVPLLMAMMHTARVQAEAAAVARAAENAAKYNAEVQTQREDVLWRIEQWKNSRKQTQSQLADARLDLGHLEDHSRRLRTELERYRNTVTELENIETAGRQKNGQSQAELQQLRRQVDVARQEVEQARKEVAGRRSSYAVVPYEGPNQTRRRPIYLECVADAVIIQPEGIRLTAEDFAGPMGPGNPLAAALRAARERLLAQREFDPQAGEPYPLLLVRSQGIAAYYAAREAMKSWGCDFGYELVDDDWRLAYPPPDPRLTEVVRQAIASARINQERLIAAAPREYPSRSKATYRASSNGGFVREDGGADDEDSGYRRATPAGSVGRNGGYAARGNGGDGPETPAKAPYNPYAALSERPGTAVPGGGGTTGAPSGGVPSDAGPALASPDGNNGGGGGIGGGPGGVVGGGVNGSIGGMSGGGTGAPANPMRGGAGSDTSSPNPYVTMPQRQETSGPGNGAPGTPSGPYGAPSGQTASQRSNGSQNNGPGVDRPDGYVVGQPARETTSPATPNPQQLPDGATGRAFRPGEWEPTPEPPPKPPEDKKDDDKSGEKKHHKPPRSLAERRGEDWGLRDAARGSVGVTRPIRIECYADRLVVVADRNPADSKVIQLGSRTASAIDPFISAIWGHIEGWGIAGRGMYWRPVLQVWVAPGGEDRFVDLAALLDGSGLTVKRR